MRHLMAALQNMNSHHHVTTMIKLLGAKLEKRNYPPAEGFIRIPVVVEAVRFQMTSIIRAGVSSHGQ